MDSLGQLKVHRIVPAVDCGIVVNRSGAEAQVEGAVLDRLSVMFHGEITVKEGRTDLLRMNEAPAVEVYFVQSRQEPSGLGEVALPPLAPAVANALFAATGKRVRKLPVRGS